MTLYEFVMAATAAAAIALVILALVLSHRIQRQPSDSSRSGREPPAHYMCRCTYNRTAVYTEGGNEVEKKAEVSLGTDGFAKLQQKLVDTQAAIISGLQSGTEHAALEQALTNVRECTQVLVSNSVIM